MKADCVDRMFDEAITLLERTRKARNALDDETIHLADDQRALLNNQIQPMMEYADILITRLHLVIQGQAEAH